MFAFDITKWTPRFILNDKNGLAVAKAIEVGIRIMNDTIQQGVDCIANYDAMPEWRLDELAWETNCLYDYDADIGAKRNWIKDAAPLYRLFGTPMAVYKYIGSYFDDIDLEEKWAYNGQAYHFRVTVDGEWTPKNEAWARKAIATAKNVRSVLDALRIGGKCAIGITAECGIRARFYFPMTGTGNWAGLWPQENAIGILDESARTGLASDTEGFSIPYPLTGTRPNTATLGATDESEIQAAQAEDIYMVIQYQMCGLDEI